MKIATYATDDGDLVIHFDCQPKERATSTYPGCEESADICAVFAGRFNILEWCSRDAIKFFEEKCLESVQFEKESK